jgi:hypothetical protein
MIWKTWNSAILSRRGLNEDSLARSAWKIASRSHGKLIDRASQEIAHFF